MEGKENDDREEKDRRYNSSIGKKVKVRCRNYMNKEREYKCGW